jgi:hypothetical protein
MEEQEKNNITMLPTYLKVGDEVSSLEFDLVTFRQKGQEERYLSINFSGFNINKPNPEPQEAFVNLGEKDFYAIKEFFKSLEWVK